MGRPKANEMVRLRRRDSVLGDMRWKVTARYTVNLSPKKSVPCVRVTAYTGQGGYTRHYSEDEFGRLFVKLPKGER